MGFLNLDPNDEKDNGHDLEEGLWVLEVKLGMMLLTRIAILFL
jgi:hypothetical protein